jgi:hypothetical protein
VTAFGLALRRGPLVDLLLHQRLSAQPAQITFMAMPLLAMARLTTKTTSVGKAARQIGTLPSEWRPCLISAESKLSEPRRWCPARGRTG